MTELERCMETLIVLFHRYAQHGDGKALNKKDLKQLIEEQLPNYMEAQKNPKLVDSIMKDLDTNGDDKLDFEEFLPLIAGLSMACEKCFMLHEQGVKK